MSLDWRNVITCTEIYVHTEYFHVKNFMLAEITELKV